MSQIVEVKVPDIGDFDAVPVIELFVKVGDTIAVDEAICTLESDKATATYDNGVLQLRIPRAEAVKPRQIRITPTVDGNATHATDAAAGEPVAETTEA